MARTGGDLARAGDDLRGPDVPRLGPPRSGRVPPAVSGHGRHRRRGGAALGRSAAAPGVGSEPAAANRGRRRRQPTGLGRWRQPLRQALSRSRPGGADRGGHGRPVGGLGHQCGRLARYRGRSPADQKADHGWRGHRRCCGGLARDQRHDRALDLGRRRRRRTQARQPDPHAPGPGPKPVVGDDQRGRRFPDPVRARRQCRTVAGRRGRHRPRHRLRLAKAGSGHHHRPLPAARRYRPRGRCGRGRRSGRGRSRR